MSPITVVKENWFTRPTRDIAYFSTLILGVLASVLGYMYINGADQFQSYLSANGQRIFNESQYWRLWTTLFAHADFAHLMGNLMLLLPFSFMITSYFGVWVFPVLGLFSGGIINYMVLKTMPLHVELIGISGVVYWMGALWITLFMFIDRRKRLRHRFALGLFFTVILFIPETYKVEISYLSHFIGYVLGVIMGCIIYFFQRGKFQQAEVVEQIYEDNLEISVTELSDDVQPPKSVI